MTHVGTVHLNVKDLSHMVAFYRERIGMAVLHKTAKTATLGAAQTPLLTLHETPEYTLYPCTTGLYHFAVRVPSRQALAHALNHLMQTSTRLQGASDHIVSEALYLPDPEGNGIEIYRDRPEETWYADGRFQMGTYALDAESVLSELDERHPSNSYSLPAGTDMGHIHLHVRDVTEAETFYRGLLGMDVMINVGSASFLSYNGYHHHVGVNTWNGGNPSPPNALGLAYWELTYPATPERDKVVSRLRAGGATVTDVENGLEVKDPSGNTVWLTV